VRSELPPLYSKEEVLRGSEPQKRAGGGNRGVRTGQAQTLQVVLLLSSRPERSVLFESTREEGAAALCSGAAGEEGAAAAPPRLPRPCPCPSAPPRVLTTPSRAAAVGRTKRDGAKRPARVERRQQRRGERSERARSVARQRGAAQAEAAAAASPLTRAASAARTAGVQDTGASGVGGGRGVRARGW